MQNPSPDPTPIFRALADPTRRSLYERVAKADEITVSALTSGSGVTQGAISQHLKSLKLAGLVAERVQGRQVFYRATPEGLAPFTSWLDHYDHFWRSRLSDLHSILKEIDP